MAVVQISRIQIRRGQANSGTGLPQLASGELAWAIDTQQLYIGNGSVAEGSPTVGNTKVLTVKDLSAQSNLLGLLQYVYKTNDTTIITGTSVNTPISYSLQTRLDNFITTKEFGTVGNGSVNDSAALQRAIDQLFLNPNGKASAQTAAGTSSRIKLTIPAGIYNTKVPLYIPSYATLVGAGADKTVINYNPVYTFISATTTNNVVVPYTGATAVMVGATVTGTTFVGGGTSTLLVSVVAGVSITLFTAPNSNGSKSLTLTLARPAVQFISDTSTITSRVTAGSSNDQPRDIYIEGISIESATGTNPCLELDSVRDSIFKNINLKGNWTIPSSANSNCTGIKLNAISSLVTCEHNLFKNITFSGFYHAVYSQVDILNNTFQDCLLGTNGSGNDIRQGFVLGQVDPISVPVNQQYGPRETQIVNTKFFNVKQQGVNIQKGVGNSVRNCRFERVGTNGGSISSVAYPIIYFRTFGNTAENNYSDRTNKLQSLVDSNGSQDTTYIATPYIPEMAGHGVYNSYGQQTIQIVYQSSPVYALRLPCSTDEYGAIGGNISYVIYYNYFSISKSFSRRGILTIIADLTHRKIQLNDEFDYAGTDPANSNALLLDFSVTFLDASGSLFVGSSGQVPGSILIRYSNSLVGDYGALNYSYQANF